MLILDRNTIITIIRLLAGLALISSMIYFFNPGATLSMMLSASPYYLALAAVIYPLMMLIYTFRWKFILSMMGDRLPLPVAYQAITGSALISDFTPGRLGDFLKPFMVRDWVNLDKGLASVMMDHYADSLTGVLLGSAGLLILPHGWSPYITAGALALLAMLFFMSLLFLKRELIMKAVMRTGHERTIISVQSFCNSIGCIKNAKMLLAASIAVSLIIWVPYSLRIFLITRSLGYDAPVYMIFFLLPLIAMLSALPVTISGMGLVEGGMTALMVMLGMPASVGISVALMDRGMAMAVNALLGGRYAVRLLRTDTSYASRSAYADKSCTNELK